jgi:threonine/homoserine/homoserine lactone efflux protein
MYEALNGIIIGLAVSAPLGPIGILCLNYGFSQGFRAAVLAGLGAALADTFYSALAGYGLTSVSDWLLEHYLIFGIFGGCFLCYIGWRIFTAPPIKKFSEVAYTPEYQAFLSTFLFTISNPLTIIIFGTLFACLAATEGGRTNVETSLLVAGVFGGSMIWWTLLSLTATLLRTRINLGFLNLVRKLVGAAVIAFGLFFIAYSFR